MSDEIMEEAVTETAAEPTPQPQEKVMSQAEIDRIVADRLARNDRQWEKRLQGIDIDEARSALQDRENARIEEQKQRGDFDKLYKDTVDKYETQIAQLKSEQRTEKVEKALFAAASQGNAVSNEQVGALLRDNVKVADDGSVEVYDQNGVVRYNDQGVPLSVNEYVQEFLTTNPHFVKATTGGVGSQGAAGGSTPKPMSAVDMVNNYGEGGREAYRAMMLKNKNR